MDEVFVGGGGGGGGVGGAYATSQTTVLNKKNVLIKPSLRFSFFCVFFVPKGNILYYFKTGSLISNILMNYDLRDYDLVLLCEIKAPTTLSYCTV